MHRRLLIAAPLAAALIAGGPAFADDPQPVKTGKERLSDKASDEQRVDDCNVPPERRGAGLRPTDCEGDRQPAAPASRRDAAPRTP